jgi:hypothetical protein
MRASHFVFAPGPACMHSLENGHVDGIHQIVIRIILGFCFLCQQLIYLLLCRIFLIASMVDGIHQIVITISLPVSKTHLFSTLWDIHDS